MVNKQTVDEQANRKATTNLTPGQEFLQELWEEHLRHEFDTHNTEDALATMVENAYVNHIPVMTGGVGKPALRKFYSKYLIPQMPPDMELTPISRTIGTDQLVDEMVAKFTHTVWMEWILPGVAPTGKRVELPVVAIVQFRDGKLAHEHIYWDQASVLVQLGLLDPGTLPVVGIDSARKVIDPNLPSKALLYMEPVSASSE
jgi:carboxymethylenebutenolidase